MKLSTAQPASAQQARPAARPFACQCPRVLQQQARVLVTVNSMWSASPEARRQHVEALQQQCSSAGWMAASVLPLAAMRAVVQPGGTGEIYFALAKAMDIYLVILTVRVLLTWFRNISWYNEPFNTLKQFTDPYLNLFRGIIPPIGGIDLSTMLGFFALQLASGQLKRLAYTC